MSYKVAYELLDAESYRKYFSDYYKFDNVTFIAVGGKTTRDELVAEIHYDISRFSTSATENYVWVVSDEVALKALAKSISMKGDALSRMESNWQIRFHCCLSTF